MTTIYQKNTQNVDQKVNQRQNTVCLEQQIYASPENFKPTLLVMLETFRRSLIVYSNIFFKYNAFYFPCVRNLTIIYGPFICLLNVFFVLFSRSFLIFCTLDDFFLFSKNLGFWVFLVHPETTLPDGLETSCRRAYC